MIITNITSTNITVVIINKDNNFKVYTINNNNQNYNELVKAIHEHKSSENLIEKLCNSSCTNKIDSSEESCDTGEDREMSNEEILDRAYEDGYDEGYDDGVSGLGYHNECFTNDSLRSMYTIKWLKAKSDGYDEGYDDGLMERDREDD